MPVTTTNLPLIKGPGACRLMANALDGCAVNEATNYDVYTIAPADLPTIKDHYAELLLDAANASLKKYPLKGVQPLANTEANLAFAKQDPPKAFYWFMSRLDQWTKRYTQTNDLHELTIGVYSANDMFVALSWLSELIPLLESAGAAAELAVQRKKTKHVN